MNDNQNNCATDLRGAGRLTIEAINGIVDIVESMHATISSMSGPLCAPARKRTRGITGLVYRNIRMVSDLVGEGIDISLSCLNTALAKTDSSPAREAILSALNGVIGDHLAATGNPLAISMAFRENAKSMNREALGNAIVQSNGKLALMIHGSCMNDLQWTRQGHNHGKALARDLGLLPLYLHYNTGRHISENGRTLAGLLETLAELSPKPLSIVIVAHSMGGLVSRSACHYAAILQHKWLKALEKIIFLGTPHHGAPLEKGGNWIDTLLGISPYSAPFSRLGKIRSAGITDLRYGNLTDDDWNRRNRFQLSRDPRTPTPLPQKVQCYAIAAAMSKDPGMVGDGLLGDGLVTVNSALGRHKKPEFNLAFPPANQCVMREMHHMDLLSHPKVYAAIKRFILS